MSMVNGLRSETAPAGTNTRISNRTGIDIPENIFRAYDIRGIAGKQLTTDSVRVIGMAIGRLARSQGIDTLSFAADARLSSPELGAALQDGLLRSGCDLVDLGIMPTPLLYFACHTSAHDSGIMLTASHNPAEYNGIKIVFRRTCLTPEEIADIGRLSRNPAEPADRGQLTQHDILPAYLNHIAADVRLQRRLRIVIDCGNAVPGKVAPVLFERLGCDVIPLYCVLDGHFPNHHPDPTIPANMRALTDRVIAEKADLGIALDGDGDRVMIVSGKGETVDTDRLLMLLARDILPRHEQPRCVFDVKCSSLLAAVIEDCGGTPVMSRSGHSFMKREMQETGAVLGGEFSAHIFIKDRWFGFDDGLYVAARFAEILSRGTLTVDEMLASLPESVGTPELRIEVSEARKFPLMERIAALANFPDARITRLDGVRADFARGWGLVRASNTTPALLLRFEAADQAALETIREQFRQLLRSADGSLHIAF